MNEGKSKARAFFEKVDTVHKVLAALLFLFILGITVGRWTKDVQIDREKADLERKIQRLTQEKSFQAELATSLHSEVDSLRTQISYLGDERNFKIMQNFENDTIEFRLAIDSLKSRHNQCQETLRNTRASLEKCSYNQEILQMIERLRGEENKLLSEVEYLNGRLADLKKDAAEQRERCEIVRLTRVRSDVENECTEAATLEADVEQNESELKWYKEQVRSKIDQIDQLQGSIGNNSTGVE